MISSLTQAERGAAMLITLAGMVAGLAMAAAGQGDPMGAHGWIVLLFFALFFGLLARAAYGSDELEDRSLAYYDDPTKVGILLSLAWAVIAMGMGVWVAAQLAWPDLRFDAAWSGFGRLRPVHTSGVIFGFGGNALIALFDEFDAAAAPCNSIAEIFEDPHYKARENIVSVEDEELGGPIRMQNVVGKLSRTPGAIRHAGPKLGSSNRSILIERLGFDEAELKAAGLPVD